MFYIREQSKGKTSYFLELIYYSLLEEILLNQKYNSSVQKKSLTILYDDYTAGAILVIVNKQE